jgi:menaquinone-9 beta-reductase
MRAMAGEDVDVLVVGAGPAGASAAYHLARRGHRVLLVDRARFPRDKVCGDGLTPRAVAALARLGLDAAGPGFAPVASARVHRRRRGEVDVPFPSAAGAVRRRLDLDGSVVERAVAAGAAFRDGVEARPLIEDRRVAGAGLTTDAGVALEARARWVIAADGASGRFGLGAGIGRRPEAVVAAAARVYVPAPPWVEDRFELFLPVEVDGHPLPGYGWVFPAGEGMANAGVYLVRGGDRAVPTRRALQAFLDHLGLPGVGAGEVVPSAPIPMGFTRSALGTAGLLVVGDAGGIANPFTGEGIGYALESGEMAAEAIAGDLARGGHGGPAVARGFEEDVRARYGETFAAGTRFDHALGRPAFLRAGVDVALRVRPLARAGLLKMLDLGGSPPDAWARSVHRAVRYLGRAPRDGRSGPSSRSGRA